MTRSTRRGVTLIELIAVLTVVVILGAILVPTLSAYRGDTRLKAAADTFAARVADGRVRAMEQGRPYQLSVHESGTRYRLAPFAMGMFEEEGSEQSVDEVIEDRLAQGVTASIMMAEDSRTTADESGWLPAATFQTDGTCKEDNVLLEITEPGVRPLYVHLRGLTGVVTIQTGDGGTP